ncbi:MAG TPA: DUF1326 domain-containing protein [Thermoanaerobaculia bacterium]|nr:DUF1326 domain-containing protein [Thermoanaerobaculia bacterium]
MKHAASVLTIAAVAALGAAAVSVGADRTRYEMKGKYYDTCACAVSCSCGANVSVPTEGHCDGVVLIHIDKGRVGDVSLDGLNFAIVLKTPQGEKTGDAFDLKGELDLLTLYLDDRATPAQRQAMPRLLAGLLGTREMKGFRPPQWAPMHLDVTGDVARFDIAQSKLSFEIENIDLNKVLPNVPRSDPGNRIGLTNAAPFPWIHEVTQGHSVSFHYDDLGVKWDYKNRNAFFGEASAQGSVPEAPPSK